MSRIIFVIFVAAPVTVQKVLTAAFSKSERWFPTWGHVVPRGHKINVRGHEMLNRKTHTLSSASSAHHIFKKQRSRCNFETLKLWTSKIFFPPSGLKLLLKHLKSLLTQFPTDFFYVFYSWLSQKDFSSSYFKTHSGLSALQAHVPRKKQI